jgi:hypothetical protein
MKTKFLWAMAVAALVSLPAGAQTGFAVSLPVVGQFTLDPATGIVLEGGAGQDITFSGQGAGTDTVGVTFGSCSGNSCTLTGTAAGSGGLLSSASFTLTSAPGAIVLTPTGTAGQFAASGQAQLTLTGSANGATGTLLTGTLNLVNFSQMPLAANGSGSVIGTFNQSAGGSVADNFTITGGLLANLFTSAGGVLQVNVQLASPTSIALLEGTSASLSAGLVSTSLTPTPEPAPLLLWAAGLALLALVGRRRARRLRQRRAPLAQPC